MSAAKPSRPSTLWAWATFSPFGVGAWTVVYAGVRVRRPLWVALGLLWSALVLAGWIWATTTTAEDKSGAGGLIIVGWVGAIATAMTLRHRYIALVGEEGPALSLGAARRRLAERAAARRLAREEPEVAREAGIGRPDLGDAHGHVVDLNGAPASAIAGLPGIDDALAARIVGLRAELGAFSSVEDLAGVVDIDPRRLDRLREQTVFLPL